MTTKSALQADGLQYCWVACIQSYDKLLTNLSDPTALFTTGQGWQGSDWSSALGGLKIDSDFEQRLTPWSTRIAFAQLSFTVMDYDGNDTFGIDVFKTATGNETRLNENITANETSISLLDSTVFPASGTVFRGRERITYTANSLNQISGGARGTLHPLDNATTSNKFGSEHRQPSVDWDLHWQPVVSDVPRVWEGRWITVYLHQITNGQVNTLANATRVFAGRLGSPVDTKNGLTKFVCVGARKVLKDKVLLADQYKGRIKEGIRLEVGEMARAKVGYGSGTPPETTTDFDVVSGAPADSSEIQAGYYSADELMSAITEWITDDGISGDWALNGRSTQDGERAAFSVDLAGVAGASGSVSFAVLMLEPKWGAFLGFTTSDRAEVEGRQLMGLSLTIPGQTEETRTAPNLVSRGLIALFGTITTEGEQGTWIDQREWIPQPWKSQFTAAGEEWGFLQVGSDMFVLAQRTSANTFEWVNSRDVTHQFGGEELTTENNRITGDGFLEIKQVLVLEGGFKDVVGRLVYSTGESGYNHATYDAWVADLGAAIPKTLLANFEQSLINAEGSSLQNAIRLVIEKPTKLEDVLGPEMALRNLYLRWKDGGIEFIAPQAIASQLSTHTLTENNKASAIKGDNQRAVTVISTAEMRNSLLVDYNRSLADDEYRDHASVRFQASIADYGERGPIKIKARNSYGQMAQLGNAVEEAIIDLTTNVLPIWGRPMRRLSRTISMEFFEGMSVGDICLVSDNFVRDPATGKRGLTSKPAMVLGHSWALGDGETDMFGTVELLFADFDNVTVWSPTAQLASYVSGTKTITCDAHEHSESSETADAQQFSGLEELRVIEIDPSDPASAQSWQVARVSGSGNDIVIDADLTGYDSAKKYRVQSAKYSVALATQDPDAYVADNADLQIENARASYEWGANNYDATAASAAPATERSERHYQEMYVEGNALTTGAARALARTLNNLVNYGTATEMPFMSDAVITAPAAASWELLHVGVFYVGPGELRVNQERALKVAPFMRSSGTGAVEVRVTLTRVAPYGSDLTSVGLAQPKKSVTFASTSNTWAIATAQSIDLVVDQWHGRCYMVVEGRSDTASPHGDNLEFRGLSICRLGPLT